MSEWWNKFETWFMSLGEQYGVNPLVFGSIYIGAIPFFSLSVAWIIRNYRRGKPLTAPILTASFFFVSAYLYLFIAGKNIPWWVYVVLLAMVVYGGYATYKSTRKKVQAAVNPDDEPQTSQK